MSQYIQAKQFFNNLSENYGQSQVLKEYEEIKMHAGEFVAALFIKRVYQDFQSLTKESVNL